VFVALGIQHAMRMHHIILPSVACPAVPYFSTLCHKIHENISKKVIEHKMCVSIFSTSLATPFSTLRRIERDMVINVHSIYVKYPLFVSDFNETEFYRQIFEKSSNKIS
jgi:hypothetical protein